MHYSVICMLHSKNKHYMFTGSILEGLGIKAMLQNVNPVLKKLFNIF